MKRNDLFIVILKFYGLYMFLEALGELAIMLLTFLPEWNRLQYGRVDMFTLFIPYLVSFGVHFCIAWLLVFKSRSIITRVFRNDKDIDLTWRMSKKTLLQISMIVLGGMFLLYNLGEVGKHVIYLWQYVTNDYEPRPGDIPQLIWEITLMIVGYALITASPVVADFLAGKIPDESARLTKTPIHKIIPKNRKKNKPRIVRPRATPESH